MFVRLKPKKTSGKQPEKQILNPELLVNSYYILVYISTSLLEKKGDGMVHAHHLANPQKDGHSSSAH